MLDPDDGDDDPGAVDPPPFAVPGTKLSASLPPGELARRMAYYAGRAEKRLPLFGDDEPAKARRPLKGRAVRAKPRLTHLYPDMKLVNCGACRRACLGESMAGWAKTIPTKHRKRLPRPVAGRVGGVPYCGDCLPGEK